MAYEAKAKRSKLRGCLQRQLHSVFGAATAFACAMHVSKGVLRGACGTSCSIEGLL